MIGKRCRIVAHHCRLPTDSIAQTDAGWSVLDRVTKRLASDPALPVISITTMRRATGLPSVTSRETRRTFLIVTEKPRCLRFTREFGLPAHQVKWVRSFAGPARWFHGVPGATLLWCILHSTPITKRLSEITFRRDGTYRGGTLLALLCGFRSVFVALKAIALNLFSVAASFGALVFVFQNGHGSSFLGVPEEQAVFPLVRSSPLQSFWIKHGLRGVLVARVLEARRNGLSEWMRSRRSGQDRRPDYERSRDHDRGIAAFTFGSSWWSR